MRMQRSHVDVREERWFFIDWLESGHVEREQANGILKKNTKKENNDQFFGLFFPWEERKERIPSR